jgi:D-glycero-D-manno-heptose 1,7-bisphosphate phosphatase
VTSRSAVFLDRDGTLIDNQGYLGDAERVRALPGATEALQVFGRLGCLRVVVTNQSGVARGLFDEHDYTAVTARVAHALPGIDATYACFHLPQGTVPPWNVVCDCRKPAPGLVLRAAHDFGLSAADLARSHFVGDDVRDLEAARAAGVRPVLVRTGKGVQTELHLASVGLSDVPVHDDVLAFARVLAAEHGA